MLIILGNDNVLSILSYLRQGEYLEAIIAILSRCFVVFCCLPIHELAHGWVANKCGDDTAKLQGRLTFNPFAHLNPIGTIMIFLFGIGYANPVPVNPARLKQPRKDMALISLAGPLSNRIMAFISLSSLLFISLLIDDIVISSTYIVQSNLCNLVYPIILSNIYCHNKSNINIF